MLRIVQLKIDRHVTRWDTDAASSSEAESGEEHGEKEKKHKKARTITVVSVTLALLSCVEFLIRKTES